MLKWILSVAIAMSAMVAVVLAEEGQKRERPTAEKVFKALDKNEDGAISEEEFLASPRATDKEKAKARFKAMDANSDGKVTLEEMKAAWEKRAKREGEGKKKK